MKHIYTATFVCLIASFLHAQPVIHLQFLLSEETPTEKIYNVVSEDFDEVLSMQYTLQFDGAKMGFKEIRFPTLDGLSSSNFNVISDGYLLTAWFDPDLLVNDQPNPVTIFQIVFETYVPGGSTLCFSTDPLETEVGLVGEILAILVIDDDCHTGLVLDPYTTAVSDVDQVKNIIDNIHFTRNGEFSFDLSEEGEYAFRVVDAAGKEYASTAPIHYTKGRNFTNVEKSFISGVYFIEVINGKRSVVVSVFIE